MLLIKICFEGERVVLPPLYVLAKVKLHKTCESNQSFFY